MTHSLPNRPSPIDYLKLAALFAVLALLFGSCRSKQEVAESYIKKAIELYPDIIQPVVKVDTIHVVSPPVVITDRIGYSQASVDSLRAICADLVQDARDENKVKIIRERFTTNVCHFDTARFYREPLDIMVWTEDGALQLIAVKHAEQLDTAVTTSVRTLNTDPCPPVKRVRSWGWVGLVVGFILGAAFILFVKGSHRYDG